MKKILLISLIALLAACGKQEAPAPAPAPKQDGCSNVQILAIDEGTSLLEVEGAEPRFRMLRSGKYGVVGDKFRFCE